MLNIGVCDDNEIFVERFKNILEKYFDDKETEACIHTYINGDELLGSKQKFDLIFLDIEMPGKDGMEVAETIYMKIKKHEQSETKIVFLTSHEEAMRYAFRVKAFRFLTKDSYEQEVYECLDSFCEEYRLDRVFMIYVSGKEKKIKQSDIIYVASIHNGVEIWTVYDIFKQKQSLKMWEEQLDNQLFVKVDKKAVANITHISYIDNQIVFMSG